MTTLDYAAEEEKNQSIIGFADRDDVGEMSFWDYYTQKQNEERVTDAVRLKAKSYVRKKLIKKVDFDTFHLDKLPRNRDKHIVHWKDKKCEVVRWDKETNYWKKLGKPCGNRTGLPCSHVMAVALYNDQGRDV